MITAVPSSTIRRLAATLFALGFLLRVLVPAGWMPAHDGHALNLMPCSGWADALTATPATAHEDHGGHGKGEHKGKLDTSAPCTFAAAAAKIAGAPTTTVPTAPLVAETAQAFAMALGSVRQGLVAPPPPSTGPPSRA